MTNHKTLTEKEIDELVIAQADDPNAWDEEIHVQPKRWRVNPARIELAAKFHVLSALHRLGAEVTVPTADQGIDVALLTNAGGVITLQVKALTGSSRWRVEAIAARQDHFVVFVCFVSEPHNPDIPPEVYVFPSTQLHDVVEHENLAELRLSDLEKRLHVRDAWHQLVPSTAA